MTDRTAPCEERVAQELERTEQYFADVYRQLDAASLNDSAQYDALHDQLEPLSIDVKRILRIMFSWGGPSDWIEVELTRLEGPQMEVTNVVYHFADWFDHAERAVSEQEAPALWRLAEYHAEYAALEG
jgi:hypothetical protein